MAKKSMLLGIYISFILMTTQSIAINSNFNDIIYVDDDGGKDFTNIQDAINSANNGDTVFIHSGVYCENIIVDKSIILEGENINETIIDGTFNGCTINLISNNVTIRGFTIINGNHGIIINGGYWNSRNNNRIVHNIIKSNNGNGIQILCDPWLDGVSNLNLISYNLIFNNRFNGISLSSSCHNKIADNHIWNNSWDGISLDINSNYNTINNNTLFYHDDASISSIGSYNLFENNSISLSKWGITLEQNTNNIIKNNNCYLNLESIHLYRSVNNIISHNILSENYEHGLRLHSKSDKNHIINNEIYLNNEYGLYLINCNENILENNTISYNNLSGFVLEHSFENSIITCRIEDNVQTGIYLKDNSNYNEVKKCSIINNRIGIELDKSNKNDIRQCISSKNTRGIKLSNSFNNNFLDNKYLNNKAYGIGLVSSNNNYIEKCILYKNNQVGIYSSESNFNFFNQNNFIDNNQTYGNVHYMGWQGDKNFFFRNYWSGRVLQSPLPYLIQINKKSSDSPIPHQRFTFNWDWFPKATPYNYDYELDWNNT